MDQMVVDVSHIPSVKQEDEVVVIGRQGNETISVQDLANLAGSIPNEIFTSLSSRVVRCYFHGSSSDNKMISNENCSTYMYPASGIPTEE
jgi:alanine racemase